MASRFDQGVRERDSGDPDAVDPQRSLTRVVLRCWPPRRV